MNLADIRTKLPELAGLDDAHAVDVIHQLYYPHVERSVLAGRLGVKAPEPEAPSRSAFAVANDTVIEAANAAAGGVSAAANFISPGNRVSKFIDENIIKAGEESQSDAVKVEKRRFREEVEQADGIGGELAAVGRHVVRNPLLTAAQAAGSFAGPAVAIKGVQGAGAAARLGEKAITRAGLGAGAATGAAMAGGDAAGNAYDLVQQAPDEVILANPAAQELAAQGLTVAQIKDRLGTIAARDASVLPAIIGAAGGVLGAERLLAGAARGGTIPRALVTGGSEAVQEGVEEGVTQFEGQRAAAQMNPQIDPGKGVAAAAGLGAVLGGATGTAVGVLSPADQVRAGKVPEAGPLTRAANAGIEAQAQAVEATTPQPAPEATAFDARMGALREQLADPLTRETFRGRMGDDAFSEAVYYVTQAEREDIPARTRDNMLALAERLLSDAITVRPGADPLQIEGPGAQPLLEGSQPLAIPLDTSPSGTFTVDAQGNAAPQTRADAISARQRAEEADSLGRGVPRGAPTAEPDPLPALTLDTAPTGRMVAGVDGVRPEVRAEAISREQRQREEQERRDTLGQQARKASAVHADLNVRPEIPALEHDTRPTGRMLAGDEVRPETQADRINLNQRQAEARAEVERKEALGITPDIERIYKNRYAATLASKREGGEIVPVEGGFVVRKPVEVESDSTPAVSEGIQKGDVLAPSGKPYKGRGAAVAAAKRRGMTVAEVPGGFVLRPKERSDEDTAARRLGLTLGGAGWKLDVGGLGEVVVDFKGASGDALRAEVHADYLGKRFDTRTAEGEPAIREAIERARAGIEAGRQRMAAQAMADQGVRGERASPALPAAEADASPKKAQTGNRTAPVETWAGRHKQGMLEHAARAQLREQQARRPDLEWTVEPAPEFGEDRFKLEGRPPESRSANQAPAVAQRDRTDEVVSAPQPVAASQGQAQQRPKVTQEKAPAGQRIEDFGETLHGSRKEYAAAFKDRMEAAEAVDIAAEPLSKSWPEPDYEKLLEGGADPFMVAFIHAARDEVPTKPQSSWKLRTWVETVKTLRGLAQSVANGEISPETFRSKLSEPRFANVARGIGGRAELYQAVGHEKSLKGMTFQQHFYTLYKGKENVTKWAVEQKAKATAFSNWPREIVSADTHDAALAAFKAKFESLDLGAKAKGATSFVIYRKRGQDGAFVGKKIGREYIDLKRLGDVAAARKYMDEHRAELEAALEKYKDTPFERRADNTPRVGEDHRGGAPVTPEVFAETFGFRGVQFGNYVEGPRRQSDLNEAFDGLMDMAAVLGIPARALSLNGRLGLAFGARGKGGKNAAAAHFEPDHTVINLTKGGGPGSLAHEWWHALDNYFAKEGGSSGFVTGGARAEAIRDEMKAAFNAVKAATQAKTLRQRARELDKRRSKPYWNTELELSARSFESYIIAKLQDQGAANDYLANVVDEQAWELAEQARAEFFGDKAAPSYPYPGSDEMPAVRAAFDEFFKTVETRTDDAGNVALFSRNEGEARGMPPEDIQSLVKEIRRGWANAPEVVIVRDMNDEAIPEAIRKEEENQRSQGASGDPDGFFYRGKVYLVASELHTDADVVRVVFHEALGHYGLRGLYGKELGTILDRLAMLNPGKVRTKARQYGLDYEVPSQRRAAAEEVLAEMAQSRPELGWVKRAVAAIRSWFRDHVPGFSKMRFTDEELIRNFILPARAFVERQAAASRDTQPGVQRFSRAGSIDSEAFRRWFGKSKVVDKAGKPLVVYHGTASDISEFDDRSKYEGGIYFTADPRYAGGRARIAHGMGNGEAANVMPVLLRVVNPAPAAMSVAQAKSEGHDGIIRDNEIVVFRPEQIKSAIGNRGTFDPKDADIRFSRSMGATLAGAMNSVRDVRLPAGYIVGDLLNGAGKLNWWHKTVGTPFNLAQRSKPFKRVYDAAQAFINDVSHYATQAADLAPSILPKLETWRDIAKSPLSAADTKAIAAPIFEGTLNWTRDEDGRPVKAGEEDSAGIVWTDSELKSKFGLNDRQVGLYREFRAAVDKSLTHLAISDMLRFGGKDTQSLRDEVMEAGSAGQAAAMLVRHLEQMAVDNPGRKAVLDDTAKKIKEKASRVADLIDRGYAPLSRFGRYTLDVIEGGERLYFGMFESRSEAARMARQMRAQFPQAKASLGTVSQEEFKLFAGVSPETAELFGGMLGLEAEGSGAANEAFQAWLKLAKANRSALKRLIERKGIAGFSEDAGRVLAGFVYSNARQASGNLHMGEMTEAAAAVSKGEGELKDHAVRLVDYVKNPQEEAQAVRGLLFAQYLGGSVASAMVNATQPFAVTFPWLSQHAGVRGAAQQMAAAVRDALRRSTGDKALDAALAKAESEGVVSPQEVHHLMAQARGAAVLKSGDGTTAGDLSAKASNSLSRLSLAWGKVFGVAEQFNRRATFIAAYRTAVEKGMADPFAFAADAVNQTQFVYSKQNRPRWARGAVGGTIFTFKTYSISYVELLHRMATSGPEGRKAALLALGVLFLMGGVDGLPFAEDVEDVIDGALQRLGYNFSTKQAKREFLAGVLGNDGAEFVERGLSGLPGVPIDVSGRLGLGNLVPGTGVLTKKTDYSRDLTEMIGPAGDFATRIAKAGAQAVSGEVGKAATTISPVAARNAIKGWDMATTGMYRDDRGRKVIDTDGFEAAAKALGFQPGSVSKVQDATRQQQVLISLNKMRETEIADKWAAGVFEGDNAKVEQAREELRRWNAANPDSPIRIQHSQIVRRVRSMRMGKAERIERTAPKEIRAAVRRELVQ